MPGIPTVDVANLGFWATCLAGLKAFFSWVLNAASWFKTHVFAFILSNKIAVSISFGAVVAALIGAIGTAISYASGFLISSFTDTYRPTGKVMNVALSIVDPFVDFGVLFGMISYGMSVYGTFLVLTKSGYVFRICVKCFDWIAKAYKL